jgi:hypothetical protein
VLDPGNYRRGVAGRALVKGQAKSRRQALRGAGFSQSVADKPTENGCTVPALIEAYRKTFPEEAAPTTRELEARSRAVISKRLEHGSEGMAVAVWRTSNEILSGEPAVPLGVSAEDAAMARRLIHAGALELLARVWARTQPGPPPEPLPDELAALEVTRLYAKVTGEHAAAEQAVIADTDDTAIEAELVPSAEDSA